VSRPASDIDAEIETVEARLAALRLHRVLAVLPDDWNESLLASFRTALGECEVDGHGGGASLRLSDHVAVYFRIDVRSEPDFAEVEETDEEPED